MNQTRYKRVCFDGFSGYPDRLWRGFAGYFAAVSHTMAQLERAVAIDGRSGGAILGRTGRIVRWRLVKLDSQACF